MKEFEINIPVVSLGYDELSEAEQHLVANAREAVKGSYAPYSNFHVGAAIALDNGVIARGANQENVAFPSGTCAERSACFSAGARFPGVPFKAIAVAARGVDDSELGLPISPCGACRQALLEYEKLAGNPVEVLLVGRDSIYRLPSVKSLLPLAFEDIE